MPSFSLILSSLCIWWIITIALCCVLYILHWCCSTSGHLKSLYEEEEMEEFDDDLDKEHPDDRFADAGEDDENILTDWSKVYEAENKVDTEMSVVNPVRKRVRFKSNKVTFAERSPEEPEEAEDEGSKKSIRRTVFVELNPAALELERKHVKEESVDINDTEISEQTSSSDNDSLKTVSEEEESIPTNFDEREYTVEKIKILWNNF